MSQQMGLMFSDAATAVVQELPAGYFLSPEFTGQELRERFAVAAHKLLSLAGPARPLMGKGLELAQAELEKQMTCLNNPTTPVDLWRVHWKLSMAAAAAFIDHVKTHRKTALRGFEYRVRRGSFAVSYYMHAEDIGTLTVTDWSDFEQAETVNADFVPWRSPVFNSRFVDEQRRVPCPHSVWQKAYAAAKLAEAGDKRANVPTFTHEGREYINDGATYNGSYAECEGWSFVLLQDWTGPTYTYQSQGRAWDEGRLERGDRRGLVVLVRGRACVLDDAMVFFDDNVPRVTGYITEDDDTEDEADNSIDLETDQCEA